MPHRVALCACFASLAVAACGPASMPPPPPPDTRLIVAVRPGPTTWFPGPQGLPTGFDHDLIARFAEERKLSLTVIEVDSAATLIAKVAAGEVHVGIGGLYAPPQSGIQTGAIADPWPILWTGGYYAVEPVLIYSVGGFKPKSWKDLEGAVVAYLDGTGIEEQVSAVRAAHAEILWKAVPLRSADALIAQVSEGDVDFAVVPSIDAAVARNIYLEFEVAFVVGPKRDLAWAVAPAHRTLRDDLDRFFAKARADALLTRLADRYFGHAAQVQRIDAGVFQSRLTAVLPDYRSVFEEAQTITGVEWRLLAALAYQESQWNPFATSETGVRGFMQITEETAKQLGIADRLDPKASTIGAARYLAMLKDKLPARIAEPDRTWLALAAFNIGIAHLEDARVLAQKQRLNPDLWSDVKKALPLLALPEFYGTAKYGYARGGMPVVFVDRVRAYYDILSRQEGPYQPRLRAFPTLATP
jgi:membrane-bound lytic murein transglycosylase F